MSRASKLREKDTRMPDPYEARRDALLQEYLQDMQAQSQEAARSERFGMLLKDLLGQDAPGFIRDYLQGKEVPLRTADRLLQGRADHLFSNVVLEFEAERRDRSAPHSGGHRRRPARMVKLTRRRRRLGEARCYPASCLRFHSSSFS